MSTPRGPELPPESASRIHVERVYQSSGAFTPALAQNVRAAAWLLARATADLWHFVFAPNPRTSAVGRMARALRRVPVIQTVASPPKEFSPEIFFGDIVVAQSRWTLERVVGACRPNEARRLCVVPPPVASIAHRTETQVAAMRHALDLPLDAPVFVYPGDLEVGCGAEATGRAANVVAAELPGAVFVFACRPKTARAPEIRRDLERRLDRRHVRFAPEGTDLIALMQASTAVLFPVDDLFGKVDLPISLLEAMKLGTPVIAYDWGPLSELKGAVHVPAHDEAALVREIIRIVRDRASRESVIERQKRVVSETYDAARVARAYEGLYSELLSDRKRTGS